MQKDVNPVLAFAIILFFSALGAAYFYLNHQLTSMDRFTNSYAFDERTFAVNYGKQILKIDVNSGATRAINLADMGLDIFRGDFKFFSNGDLLIRLAGAGRSAFRIDTGSLSEQQISGGALYRCDLMTKRCAAFSDQLPVLDGTFRLVLDAQDTVFFSDTNRHTLRKLDSKGNLLASLEDFRYPNQLLLQDGRLFVADTNKHRIAEVDISDENFGDVIASHKIKLGGEYRWPTELAFVDNHWWVVVTDDLLANSKVALFDTDWQFSHTLNFSTDSQIGSIAGFGDQVVIVDYQQHKLFRFNLQQQLEDLVPGSMEPLLEQQREAMTKKKNYQYLVIFIA